MIPQREECFAVLTSHLVPENIVAHSVVVERVALFLAGRLILSGNEIDTALVSAGALLHDVAKMRGITENLPHGDLGAEVTHELGFAEVTPIVRQHVRLDDYEDNGRIDEVKLVNYADKRVNHDQIVTLDDRFVYLLEHYAVSEAAMQRLLEMKRLTNRVEQQIFRRLSIRPEDVGMLIEEEDSGFHSR